ncbi:putative membrane protein [Actinopolyspora xinjiangensis]|uniref:Putative membrane protein n=1 Tax=Actinopolyspora xinjiangensis TaxID=405564 RepID=A0A1H0W377_9ACTN|nr:PH domain-containing protein [Actinopolyspora xinjiangensis]SDP85200.1 putative membrane protein [Actinopolyspora xinjiangensis]
MNEFPPEEATAAPTPPPGPFEDWQRLDPKAVVASTALVVAPMFPIVAIMAVSDDGSTRTLTTAGVLLGVVVLTLVGSWLRWYFTRFRVTAERFELREGNISRSFRSIPRERVRSVDLTAPVVHRLLGISVVKIGTGQKAGSEGELKLDAISTARAEELRRLLLRPRAGTTPESATPPVADSAEETGTELARMRPTWYLYSTLTASLLLFTWAAVGSALSTLSDVFRALWAADTATDWLSDTASSVWTHAPLWAVVVAAVVTVLVGGLLGALAFSVEMWWGFRLTREGDATLRVRRGLLTTRAVSLERRRLRGVELAEPMLLRLAGGSRLTAVATGLEHGETSGRSDNKALLPPAPRGVAGRIGALVLERPGTLEDGAPLRAHPRVALRRRLSRVLLPALLLASGLAVAAHQSEVVPWWSWLVPLGTAPPAVVLAWDAYRNLGHGHRDEYLVTRYGTGVKRTVLLQREGIIGWRISQSPLQRLAGLLTVSATTAAGNGYYSVRDAEAEQGLSFAESCVPGLLSPFLEKNSEFTSESVDSLDGTSHERAKKRTDHP